MEYMKNQYYVFDDYEWTSEYSVKNFTRLDTLPKIPEKYFTSDYIQTYQVPDDSRLELIAFKLWGDSNYWDILMALNKMTKFNQLPKNHDIILENVQKKMDDFISRTEKITPKGFVYTTEILEEKRARFLEEEETINEEFRNIIYIEKSNISDLLADLLIIKDKGLSESNLLVF